MVAKAHISTLVTCVRKPSGYSISKLLKITHFVMILSHWFSSFGIVSEKTLGVSLIALFSYFASVVRILLSFPTRILLINIQA
jgi:hypothetical protein